MKEAGLSNSSGKSMVNILPFEVHLVRITQQEISKYTRKCLPSEIPQSGSGRSSPVRTRSMRFRSLTTHSKKCTISGRPTQWLISKTSTFNISRHNLYRHKQKLSLKCRIKGCTLAYVSFNMFKDLNAHHHIYHPSILFKCPSCGKSFATPVHGIIINTDALAKSYLNAPAVENDSCSTAHCDNIIEGIYAFMADVIIDISTHKT